MKTVLSLAVLCAMAATPALAAGGAQRSGGMDQPYGSQQGMTQQGMPGSQQQSMNQAPGQALDESMVRQIQQQLSSQGYDVQADGIFGPNTRQALRQFQQEQGMQATGRVDMDTLAALGVMEGDTQQAQTPQDQRQQQQQMRQQDNPEQDMEGQQGDGTSQ